MVVLKRIKGSTLMETLVATMLIMIIFMLASMILNNLFSSSVNNNTRAISAKLNELEYLYENEKLVVPYYDDYNNWTISVETIKSKGLVEVLFQAHNGKKTLETKKLSNED